MIDTGPCGMDGEKGKIVILPADRAVRIVFCSKVNWHMRRNSFDSLILWVGSGTVLLQACVLLLGVPEILINNQRTIAHRSLAYFLLNVQDKIYE